MTDYQIVIGLETHVRVKSKTKMFDRVANAIELEREPNTNVSPVSMGFPGALPVLSEGVVDLAVRASLGMKMTVNEYSAFDRKSYSYPDLPIGYQITQLYHPIAEFGSVQAYVGDELKTFAIERMHIEADAGKLTHSATKTLCDYNRAAAPLMEIVTEPCFHSKEDVLGYLKELQKLMRFTGASDADMEKGQLRCDVNISVRPIGQEELNPRVELKNLNSFQQIGRAIDYEVGRQKDIYADSGSVDQETRGWNDEKGISISQRSKEDAMDYRYFPEPDLPPLILTQEYIQARMPDILPIEVQLMFRNEYKLSDDDARILSKEPDICRFYMAVVAITNDPKKTCSYVSSTLLGAMNEEQKTFDTLSFSAKVFAEVITMVNNDELSSNGAGEVITELVRSGGSVTNIVESKGLKQNNDTSAMQTIVDEVVNNNPTQVADYKGGNDRIFGFFVGQCMKQSKGQGNPKIFTDILKKILDT